MSARKRRQRTVATWRQQFLAWLIDKRDEWGQETLGFEFEGDLWYL